MEWITCENTYEEAWRRLLEYANVELAIAAIESIHGAATKKTLPHYKKQAEQTRVSLLQAKEYFEAARTSSLYTQPNHLYYGSVALTTACMLIRGSGEYSLDYLRRDKKNAHHGLDFTFSSNQQRAKEGLNLLENSFVKVCPNGHFKNWYSTLHPTIPVAALQTLRDRTSTSTNYTVAGGCKIPDIQDLIGEKGDLLSLIRRLPDLCSELKRYGVHLDYARGEHCIEHEKETGRATHTFIFHNAVSHEALLKVVDEFNCKKGVNFVYDIQEGASGGTVETRPDSHWGFSYPNSRTTLDHKTIYYGDSVDTPEVVDLFAISYALSMLSRYFPDIWISFLESHCKGSKLVERVIRLLILKTPSLMLNEISNTNYIISNHRPFWH